MLTPKSHETSVTTVITNQKEINQTKQMFHLLHSKWILIPIYIYNKGE